MSFIADVGLGDLELGVTLMFFCCADTAPGLRRHWLGKGRGQRGHQFYFNIFPHAVLGEKPVGHEGEFQGSHRAFKRQLGDIDNDPALVEIFQLVVQGDGAVLGIEVVDIASHPGGHAFHFIRHDAAAGGHHQPVIGDKYPAWF